MNWVTTRGEAKNSLKKQFYLHSQLSILKDRITEEKSLKIIDDILNTFNLNDLELSDIEVEYKEPEYEDANCIFFISMLKFSSLQHLHFFESKR